MRDRSLAGLIVLALALPVAASGSGIEVRRALTPAQAAEAARRGVPWRGPVIGTSGTELRAGSRYQAEHTNRVDVVPVLSVYSAHDNMVHPVETSQLDRKSTRLNSSHRL